MCTKENKIGHFVQSIPLLAYAKAFALTKDKNFKARCLFMMAKCDQKQITMPTYGSYPEYADYEKAKAAYQKSFQENRQQFTVLAKEYNTTPFYKMAYNTCSYLSDFVRKMK